MNKNVYTFTTTSKNRYSLNLSPIENKIKKLIIISAFQCVPINKYESDLLFNAYDINSNEILNYPYYYDKLKDLLNVNDSFNLEPIFEKALIAIQINDDKNIDKHKFKHLLEYI